MTSQKQSPTSTSDSTLGQWRAPLKTMSIVLLGAEVYALGIGPLFSDGGYVDNLRDHYLGMAVGWAVACVLVTILWFVFAKATNKAK